MDDAQLQEALKPVLEFFRATEVSENTVLAAYIRKAGGAPTGKVWQFAKEEFIRTEDFNRSARIGVSQRGHARPPAAATAKVEVPAQTPAVQSSPPNQIAPSRRRNNTLEWFPKPFGPGDIDGDGAKRLLGNPSLPVVSVLVRETAQNSWDARLRGEVVSFRLNLRLMNGNSLRTLRESVFTGASSELGLRQVLDRDEFWVLEVSDRGTCGLNGPTRNDLVIPVSSPTNYIDLILNIGAPRDVDLGGGTYGFGKTIAYNASSCGTVLIWSRSDEGSPEPEDRLIGSAIGPGFDDDKRRYTGRHWWGVAPEDGSLDRVEPLTGAIARSVAESVFESRFIEEQTGTSILILDPQLGGASIEEDIERLVDSVTWHLWPKLTGSHRGDSEMEISVALGGVDVDMPNVREHPILSGHVACLDAVRAVQNDGQMPDSNFTIEVQEIASQRPIKVLGHVAMTMYPSPMFQEIGEQDDSVASIVGASHHLTLMRHEAELVVRYDPRAKVETDGIQWAAVFKPVADVDDSFAAAEPPAHDEWIPKGVADRAKASQVNIAINRLRQVTASYVAPQQREINSAANSTSVAGLADSLADLIPTVDGSRPTTGTSSRGSSSTRKISVQVSSYQLGPVKATGRRFTSFEVNSQGAEVPVSIEAKAAIAVDGGLDAADGEVEIIGWSKVLPDLNNPVVDTLGARVTIAANCHWLIVDSSADIAVGLSVDLAEDDS